MSVDNLFYSQSGAVYAPRGAHLAYVPPGIRDMHTLLSTVARELRFEHWTHGADWSLFEAQLNDLRGLSGHDWIVLQHAEVPAVASEVQAIYLDLLGARAAVDHASAARFMPVFPTRTRALVNVLRAEWLTL